MFLKEPNFIVIGTVLILLTIPEGKGQSSPAEIDSLFYRAIALGNINLDSTLGIAQDMVILSKEFHDEYGEVKAKILSAHVYFNRFKLDTTQRLLNECEDWFRNHPAFYFSQNHGRVQLYQARLSTRKQEYRLARIYGKEALVIFRKIKDAKYEGDVLSLLGVVESLMENYTASLAYYVEGMRLHSNSIDESERLAPDLLLNISLIYGRMGQYDNARNYARKSLNATRGENTNVPNILNSIGTYHNSENRFDSAIFYFERSRKQAIENNDPRMVAIAEYNIANTFSRSGEYRKSLASLKKTLSAATVLPPGTLEISEQLIAKNYFSLGLYDSAILTARKTLVKNIRRNSKISVVADADVLSKSFQSLMRPDSVVRYLKIKNAYQDSIYRINNQKKLSALYAEMETIAKQKEIEILQQDAELAIAQNKILELSVGFGTLVTPLGVGVLALYLRNRRKKQKLLSYQLSTELDQRKKDLHRHALRMIYINNGLTEIERVMKKINSAPSDHFKDIQNVFDDIQMNHSLEEEWNHFDRYFGCVYVGFYEKFNAQYPQLTQLEKRLAGLVRMNLTNSEIAGLLNIESKSVKMAKYRLKKKLEVNDEQDINQFLQNFG
jgi:tetratricopeptide (TPR) repeat protein